MDNASLQSLLKRLCTVLWAANVTNPITYVTQISYLLFLKMLEEMEAEQATFAVPLSGGKKPARAGTANGGKRPAIFTTAKAGDETVDFAKLRWSVLTSDPDNDRMLRTLRDLLPKLGLVRQQERVTLFTIRRRRSSRHTSFGFVLAHVYCPSTSGGTSKVPAIGLRYSEGSTTAIGPT